METPTRQKKPQKLPKARQRYYIDEPVIVVRLADYQRLIEHLVSLGMYDQQPKNVQVGLRQRHTLLLKEAREQIKAAKRHYHISDGARRARLQTEQTE